MKKLTFLILLIFIVASVFAAKPALKKTVVTPEKVKLGAEVSFVLTFSGKKEDIKSIKLFSVEFPYEAPIIELQPDPESKDNVWKAVGPVPYEAPLGIYNWEIKAVDKKDKEIVDKDCKDQTQGKTGKLAFEIIS
ncbi:MAG: hypothetical protein HQ541_20215 [Mariniphaga sp.]|nr:hypothetical protein [Mariniphaga sp.]